MIRTVLAHTIVTPAWEEALTAFETELGWERLSGFPTDPAWLALHGFDPARHGWTVIVRCPGSSSGFIRLVEGDSPPAPRTTRRSGIFNVELLVSDVDLAHSRLRDSRIFRAVSEPHSYDMRETGAAFSRSFATTGPGGAGVFFTQLVKVPPPRTPPKLSQLFSHAFNGAIAAESLNPVLAFYEGALSMSRRFDMRIAQPEANQILGLPDDASFRMVVFKGAGDGLIEVDIHDTALDRPLALPGQLASGNSILTLEASAWEGKIEALRSLRALRAEPRPIASPPYDGRQVALATGPSGELIEIVG